MDRWVTGTDQKGSLWAAKGQRREDGEIDSEKRNSIDDSALHCKNIRIFH